MKVGIIGFGGSGKGHLRIMKEVDGIEVKGAFDINENAKKEILENGLKFYSTLEEMLEDKEINTIVISSISFLHGEQGIKALKSGKNVIVEKPMATNLEEAENMVKIAKEKNLLLTVFHNRRFDPDVEEARKFIKDGLIGKVLYIRNMIFLDEPSLETGWRRFKKFGGGVLLDWGSHLIDQVIDLVGDEVKEVIGDIRYVPLFDDQQDADNHFVIFIKFKDGCMAEIGFSRVSHISFPKLYIQGERGTIQAQTWKSSRVIVRYTENGHLKEKESEEKDIKNYWKEVGKKFYQNFIDVLKGKCQLLITPESALKTMRVIEKVKREIG